MASEEFSGPVDYLVFSFDQGTDIGPGLQALLDRVDQGIIEVLDIELISKDSAGHPSKGQFADLLDVTGFDLDLLEGVYSGILDAEDLDTIVADLEEASLRWRSSTRTVPLQPQPQHGYWPEGLKSSLAELPLPTSNAH